MIEASHLATDITRAEQGKHDILAIAIERRSLAIPFRK